MSVALAEVDAELRRARRERLWTVGPGTRALAVEGDALDAVLPHRPPFRLVDAVTAVDPVAGTIAGYRRLHPKDPVFAGHFPGDPVYPGVLLVEAVAQLLACLGPLTTGWGPVPAHATACRAAFLRPVRPGDTLDLLAVRVGGDDGLYARGIGQVLRAGVVCAVALIEAAPVPPPEGATGVA